VHNKSPALQPIFTWAKNTTGIMKMRCSEDFCGLFNALKGQGSKREGKTGGGLTDDFGQDCLARRHFVPEGSWIYSSQMNMVMGVSADFHSMLMQLEQFVTIHQIYSASTFFYVPIVLTSNVGCWHVKSGFHAST
jgi:hypothetical protein